LSGLGKDIPNYNCRIESKCVAVLTGRTGVISAQIGTLLTFYKFPQLHPFLRNVQFTNAAGDSVNLAEERKSDAEYTILNFWNSPEGLGLKITFGLVFTVAVSTVLAKTFIVVVAFKVTAPGRRKVLGPMAPPGGLQSIYKFKADSKFLVNNLSVNLEDLMNQYQILLGKNTAMENEI
ncbi:hypothetical protein HPG69_008181, partial [Diceros bicornis minor]